MILNEHFFKIYQNIYNTVRQIYYDGAETELLCHSTYLKFHWILENEFYN